MVTNLFLQWAHKSFLKKRDTLTLRGVNYAEIKKEPKEKKMRGITFNKQNLRGICIFCKKNTVPLGHHMERCEECKKKRPSLSVQVLQSVKKSR